VIGSIVLHPHGMFLVSHLFMKRVCASLCTSAALWEVEVFLSLFTRSRGVGFFVIVGIVVLEIVGG
jgi:hypothetical protein